MQTPSGLTHNGLLQTLEQWDRQIQFPTRLIACGDAALTLLDIKLSAQTVDLIVPVDVEYELLLDFRQPPPPDDDGIIAFGLGKS